MRPGDLAFGHTNDPLFEGVTFRLGIPGNDWERTVEWANKEQKLSQTLEQLMTEWLALSEELGAIDQAAGEAER